MVVSNVGQFFIIGIKNQQVSITYMDLWLTILKKSKNQVWPQNQITKKYQISNKITGPWLLLFANSFINPSKIFKKSKLEII
jgi:hypothetical protein